MIVWFDCMVVYMWSYASITIGMGVIFLITNGVNKQIILQPKVWIIKYIIKFWLCDHIGRYVNTLFVFHVMSLGLLWVSIWTITLSS